MNASLKLILATTAIALTLPAWADDEDDKDEERYDPTYSAIRITAASTDFDNLDTAVNLGFTLGIKIPPIGRYLAAEIDLSTTLIPGENKGAAGALGGGGGGGGGGGILDPITGGGGDGGGDDSGDGSSSGKNTTDSDDLQLNTVGIFLTGRSPGNFFGMARAGYRFTQSTINELEEDNTGAAFGAGFGYRYAPESSVELSYTRYGSDLNYISLVVNY